MGGFSFVLKAFPGGGGGAGLLRRRCWGTRGQEGVHCSKFGPRGGGDITPFVFRGRTLDRPHVIFYGFHAKRTSRI